ncbi:MAG: alkaline phosphatase family protein [Candidatus Baltobacteraceae bacterium]
MWSLGSVRYVLAAGLIAAVLSACGGNSVLRGMQPEAPAFTSATASSPIAHVVLIVQENRTFNDFFATFPGADGTTLGKVAKNPQCHIYKDKTVRLQEKSLLGFMDYNHYYQAYRTARDGGKMDGFDDIIYKKRGSDSCLTPYQYTDPSQIRPYWEMAKQYALGEHMFTPQGGGGFTGHQELITDGTLVAPGEEMVNFPTCNGPKCHWGCDAPSDTHTSLINEHDVLEVGKGPFPCSNDYAVKYPTIRDLLDAKGLSWKYYAPHSCCNVNGRLFNAFDAIYPVRYGPEWKTNISSPETNIFNDISSGSLAAVSWVIPNGVDSDHPGAKVDDGPSWVASIVNAVGESPYWQSTAIVVVWDDWGGFYDNFDPPQRAYGGFGFRVPALIVSPYAKAGYISPTYYEFNSILKYIEQNWNLGYLGNGDRNANSLRDCFDYSQTPITFSPIPSEHDKSYFMHRKAPDQPLDDD